MSARDSSPLWYLLLTVAIVALVASAYGHCMYGSWKCGMPEVKCRIEVTR